jgi:hypothetical protein
MGRISEASPGSGDLDFDLSTGREQEPRRPRARGGRGSGFAHRYQTSDVTAGLLKLRAAASRHKRPRNADLVFTRLHNEVNIFSNVALICRPMNQEYQR